MIEIEERQPTREARIILVIGPGATGKTSLGAELAPLLKRRLADLDQEFLRRVGDIGAFIREEGYEGYKTYNSKLATKIANETTHPMILVTSSGFLTPDNPQSALNANRSLVASSYSICLLPSRNTEESVSIIVERQLTRPFARDAAREEAVIRDRLPIYLPLGDLVVFSAESPAKIARAVTHHLSQPR